MKKHLIPWTRKTIPYPLPLIKHITSDVTRAIIWLNDTHVNLGGYGLVSYEHLFIFYKTMPKDKRCGIKVAQEKVI